MKTTKEKAGIMLAQVAGRTIQQRANITDKWQTKQRNNIWNWIHYDYRIKPVPKEIYINEPLSGYVMSIYETEQEAINAAGISHPYIRVAVKYIEAESNE